MAEGGAATSREHRAPYGVPELLRWPNGFDPGCRESAEAVCPRWQARQMLSGAGLLWGPRHPSQSLNGTGKRGMRTRVHRNRLSHKELGSLPLFTTFYNRLLGLDTRSLRGLYIPYSQLSSF